MKPKANFDKYTGLPYLREDLTMRIGRSVIRYDGIPVYVHDIEIAPDVVLTLIRITDQDIVKVRLPDPKLNIKPVPLGYMNISNKAVYLSRKPHRKYKQGLCPESLYFRNGGFLDRKNILLSSNLANCILNEYPDFDTALSLVKIKGGSCAFSRKFALSKDGSGLVFLEYRAERVGWYTDKIELGESHFFLREELETVYAGA